MSKKIREFKERMKRAAKIGMADLVDIERQTKGKDLSFDEIEAMTKKNQELAEQEFQNYKKQENGNNDRKTTKKWDYSKKLEMKRKREEAMAADAERRKRYEDIVQQQLRSMQEDNER